MKNEKHNEGSIWGLLPLVVFLVLYLLSGFISGSFDNMPLMIGITIACMVAFFLPDREGEHTNFEERVTIFCKGGGDDTLILMVLIFLLAGAFFGITSKMHAVDTFVNMGLTILPARFILPGLFIISCIISFAMGSSMGTIAALIPIGMDMAAKTNSNLALVCGIVVGGAMFGDELSFISDTTIAATKLAGIENRDKFRANFPMVMPACVVTVILLAFQPINVTSQSLAQGFNLVNLIPYLVIIVLSFTGMNVLPIMVLGILSGTFIGIAHHDFTFFSALKIMHEGMISMEDIALVAVLVGGMVALMKYFGGIDYLLAKLTKKAKTARGGELSIAALASLVDIATANNTISIITTTPISCKIADDLGIDRRRVASIVDIYSCVFNGTLPYASQLLIAGSIAGIPPISISPYVWYCYLMFFFATLFIIIRWPKKFTSGEKVIQDKIVTAEQESL